MSSRPVPVSSLPPGTIYHAIDTAATNLAGGIATVDACVAWLREKVFHHEFFHHIVESTATTLEILSASFGDQPRPIYRNYRDATHRRLGSHPHEPLEEALANAYAHNSFSFLSRSRLGFRTVQAQRYQDVMRRTWQLSSEGYRHAAHYAIGRDADSGYVSGGAQLLAMLLASDKLDPGALLLVAQRVMPRGHTALVEKADVPTFLVGGPAQITHLLDLVPAPNETYTGLFLPWDTSELDAALRARHKATTRREPGAGVPRS